MKRPAIIPTAATAAVLGMLFSAQAQAFFLPEIPFCPLGGPPGWANRVMGVHNTHRPLPPPMPPSYYGQRHSPPPTMWTPRGGCPSGRCPVR